MVILSAAVVSLVFPISAFAQTTTLDVAGKWDGTVEFTVSFDYYPSRVTCGFSGTATVTLTQSGNSVSGYVSGDAKGNPGNHSACFTHFASYAYGDLDGDLFGSSFTGTIGPGNIQGSFTSDTFFGTFFKSEQYSGDVGVNGEITLNKFGFTPTPEPTPEPEPIPELEPTPKPTPELEPEPIPELEEKDSYQLFEECRDFELILRKKTDTIIQGDTASFPIFVGHVNPSCDVLQKHVTVALSLTLDSQKLRQDGDWGFPIITAKSFATTAPFDTTLKVFTLPTIPSGPYSLMIIAEDSDGNQKTETIELTIKRPESITEPTPALKERISYLKGDVKIKRTSSGETQKLDLYSTIYPGDIIITGKDGQVNVVDPAGYRVEIKPNSEFQFTKLDSQKLTFELYKGKVYTFFKKNFCLSCKIATPVAHAGVRATEFVTTHTEGITMFDLKEGALQVTNLADGEIILLSSGNTVTVDNFAMYVKPLTDERLNILTDEFVPIPTITEKIQPEPDDDQANEYYGYEVYSGFDGPDGSYDGPGDVRSFDDEYDDDYDFYEYEDPENIVYGLHDLRYYNIGIEIPKHWKVFALIDKSEFPARTYYSMWYNTWMNWIEISLFHDIGQRIDLQNFDEGIRSYEDYKRQWCEETKENPIFLDEPDDSGWQTCLELKNFDFKKIIIDGREGIHVSYLMKEKFEFEDYPDETEFDTWQFWENLIPYGDDVIVVTGETLSKNAGQQKSIILDSINSFKILNDGKPIFDETTAPTQSRMMSGSEPRGFAPTVSKLVTPTPTLEFISTPNEKVSDLISLKLDQSQIILKRHEPIQLKISGEVENYARGARVIFTITDPEGIITVQKVIATKDGYFENYLGFDSKAHSYGEYKIQVQYQGEHSQTVSLKVKPLLKEISKDVQPVKERVPGWIKNNAKWWSEGQIGDSDFVGGIQHMIKEDIISIPNLPEQASTTAEEHVPDWIRNNAGWWADGLISEDDFVNGIKWLVENGLIKV